MEKDDVPSKEFQHFNFGWRKKYGFVVSNEWVSIQNHLEHHLHSG